MWIGAHQNGVVFALGFLLAVLGQPLLNLVSFFCPWLERVCVCVKNMNSVCVCVDLRWGWGVVGFSLGWSVCTVCVLMCVFLAFLEIHSFLFCFSFEFQWI